jgi:hypothetical protein
MFDGRSAFWQQPTPIEKVGEFKARVRLCEYEVRDFNKTFFSTEKIEDVWYRETGKEKNQKAVHILNATPDKRDDEGGIEMDAAAEKHRHPPARGHTRFENLYKTVVFHGTCVRNKSGYFPCPKTGKLFDEGQEFDVEYDGTSLLSDCPTPTKLKGTLTCTVPAPVKDPSGKFQEERFLCRQIQLCCLGYNAWSERQQRIQNQEPRYQVIWKSWLV